MQLPNGIFPPSAIDVVIPIGNQIVDRTPGLAKRDPAIHAACTLFAQLFFRKILVDFEPVIDALEHRTSWSQFAVVVHEASRLTHVAPAPRWPELAEADRECRLGPPALLRARVCIR